jgi:hypothetical protein
MTKPSKRNRPSQQKGDGPVHRIPWYPHDWISSPLRLQLVAEQDHLSRLGYFELLMALYEAGGRIRRTEAAGAMLLPGDEVERVVTRLVQSGRIRETKDGFLINDRVTQELRKESEFRKSQQAKALKRWSGTATVSPPAVPRDKPGNAFPSPSPSPSPPPSPSPSPSPSKRQRHLADIGPVAVTLADRVTAITNAVLDRRLGRNRALGEGIEKALKVGYTADEVLQALWSGLCGPDSWWRSETGGNAALTLLIRFQGGVNPSTGQPAKQFLPELSARFGDVYPARITEAVAKLRAANLDDEVKWLQDRKVRGSE